MNRKKKEKKQRMKKCTKRFLCFALAVLSIIGAAACGNGGGGAGKKGGHVDELVIGTTKQIEGLSILDQSGSFGRLNYNSVVYANFFYPDNEGTMQPYFLESYKISDDSKELTMVFPTDKVWHDGVPVTVDDVVFTFEFMRDVYGQKALRNLSEIRVDADNQVTLVFSQPDAFYYVKNANLTYFVIPKHVWEKVDDYSTYTGEDAMIGCGPYKVVNVNKEAGVIQYEAVPENDYLGEITVDKITLRSYSNQDALLMALANGEIDVMYEYANPIPYTLLDVISGKDNIEPGMSDYTGCNQVTFGMNRDANQYHEFREAALKCFDWKLITQLINGEYGEIPGSGILPRACAGFDGSLWMFYQDAEEAKRLLDNAGFKDTDGDGFRELPDGKPFTYRITSQLSPSRNDLYTRIGQLMADNLKAVGVNAYFDTEALASEEVNDKMVADNEYDLFIGYTTSGVAAYRTCFWYFLNREIVGSGAMNWGGSYNDPALNAAYVKLMNAKSNDEYLEAVKELQHLASNDLFAFALCWEKCFFPYRTDKYEGFVNMDAVGVVHAETFYQLTNK